MSGLEIERKFLVEEVSAQLAGAPATEIDQGYLVLGAGASEARVRRRAGAFTLTVKRGGGLVRGETEIELSEEQFERLWPLTEGQRVRKRRHELPLAGDLVAEVDVYADGLQGLIVAEVEFPDEATAAAFTPPAWLGREVTEDPAYKNRRLATDGRPG